MNAAPKLCECGECGLPAPIAKRNDPRWGHIKGQPIRFIRGHYARVMPRNAASPETKERLLAFNAARSAAAQPSYSLAHDRLGPVSGLCVDGCGRPAKDWSLRKGVPAEFLQSDADGGKKGLLFSLRGAEDYEQRCQACHNRFDHSGEQNGFALLTWVKVAEIRRLYSAGGATQEALAQQFGVDQTTISSIILGNTWRDQACAYCFSSPAPYRITEEDGQRIFLCAECREDVEYCARGGKPEPERNEPVDEVEQEADCGIAEPHAPGMHPPAFDLLESYEEPDEDKLGRRPAPEHEEFETAAGRTVREGTDRSFFDGEDEDLGEVGQGIAQRAAEARARIFGREHYPALIAVAALASLGLTILFTLQGRWILALLV